MSANLKNQIAALNDRDVMIACRSLVVLLDQRLKNDPNSSRPKNVNPAALDDVVNASGPAAELKDVFTKVGDAEAAAAARGLLMMCVDLGYEDEVEKARGAAGVHVRDLGILSGPLLVAALAAMVAWVPVRKKSEITSQTVTTADGTTLTTEKKVEDVERVGAAALTALKEWWLAIVPKA
jgi:hypothetical protein